MMLIMLQIIKNTTTLQTIYCNKYESDRYVKQSKRSSWSGTK